VATDKARTAAIYRRESRDFEEQVAAAAASALHLAGRFRCRRIPIAVGGQVSARSACRRDLGGRGSRAGAARRRGGWRLAANDAQRARRVLPARSVDEKFATGGLLLEKPSTRSTRVAAAARATWRSTTARSTSCTCLEGEATVVAGERTPTSSHEGDVLEIPAGVPHSSPTRRILPLLRREGGVMTTAIQDADGAPHPASVRAPAGRPDAIVDLQTAEGTRSSARSGAMPTRASRRSGSSRSVAG
jgi:mannose-6-phosphate isomerase-like protein (cupin superfamily)